MIKNSKYSSKENDNFGLPNIVKLKSNILIDESQSNIGESKTFQRTNSINKKGLSVKAFNEVQSPRIPI